jgi:putative transposase
MAHKLIRHYGRGHRHFITFTCDRRLPLLRTVRARNAFVQILGETRDRYGFSLVGYVVMAEHIHLLISGPAKCKPSTVIQVLTQRVSRCLRRKKRNAAKQFCLAFARGDESLCRFWQRRFYDFNVWSLKKKAEKLHYMHMNPLKRKLVDHPRDWPWSSFCFYARKETGLVRIDSVHGCEQEIKVKNPALEKTSRTGHPKFNFKGRATRLLKYPEGVYFEIVFR